MFYYISINSWNLLESFVSESISPFSFYQVRGYGNNLSRYIDGTNERVNYLILSTKKIDGDYILKVNEDILDKSNITPVKKSKTLFTYSKTIYYKKGAVAFLFSSNDLLESFVAESQILFEVKCIEKYGIEREIEILEYALRNEAAFVMYVGMTSGGVNSFLLTALLGAFAMLTIPFVSTWIVSTTGVGQAVGGMVGGAAIATKAVAAPATGGASAAM